MQVTDSDAQLQLKKRARRRLVGAVAFVTFAAIVLPMVMDQAPPPPTPDVQIRIPGQDQTAFNPQALNTPAAPVKTPAAPKAEVAVPPVVAVAPETPAAPPVPPAQVAKAPEKVVAEKPVEKPAEKAPAKPAEKANDKVAEKLAAEKAAADKAKADAEAKRAAALLGGGKNEAKAEPKPAPAAAAAAGGQHVILIGAFANQGNVKVLQAKLSEIGVKTYTEPLESPQGVKTRVRAGPFANKDAADKALEKMKKIGVSGIVSAK